MTVTQIPHWSTVPDAAKKTGFSAWTIRREIAEGRLRARYVGRNIRVLDEDLADWVRTGGGGDAA